MSPYLCGQPHCTTSVSCAVLCTVVDPTLVVAVIVIAFVYVPEGVATGGSDAAVLSPPPPHDPHMTTPAITSVAPTSLARFLVPTNVSARIPTAKAIPSRPLHFKLAVSNFKSVFCAASPPLLPGVALVVVVLAPVVGTLTVNVVAAFAVTFTLPFEILQLVPVISVGSLHASATVPVKPPIESTSRLYVAVPPAVTVCAKLSPVGGSISKSIMVPVTAATWGELGVLSATVNVAHRAVAFVPHCTSCTSGLNMT